jgi:hypothetical protein
VLVAHHDVDQPRGVADGSHVREPPDGYRYVGQWAGEYPQGRSRGRAEPREAGDVAAHDRVPSPGVVGLR